MKYLILVLTTLISLSAVAQEEILLKTDGTKYYIEVYDGVNNDKILFHNSAHADWQTKIQVADFFDGSNKQLWSFEATEMFPGYFSIVNYDDGLTLVHHLMSWSWNAYFADNRDPLTDQEMQYRVVEAPIEGYFILETIEKPAGLYGIEYTPGADAMNVKPDGFVSFSEIKSADITSDNMANKIFRFVEFDPVSLFKDAVERGQELYETNIDVPESERFNLFYVLEKAREIIVFEPESEILVYQPILDEAIARFTQIVKLLTFIEDNRAYIDTLDVDEDIKASFTALVDDAENMLNAGGLDSDQIDELMARIESAKKLIEAIIAAQAYGETLADNDASLLSGLNISIEAAKATLAEITSLVEDYKSSIAHLQRTQEIIVELISAAELIANTQEFEEAKIDFQNVVDLVTGVINIDAATLEELDQALLDIKAGALAFIRALEAGDTPVEITNWNFERGLDDWNVDSPTPGSAYPENKGVDGSRSITCWSGSEYQMKVFQLISDIPNGTYLISCQANVNTDNSFGLFAKSESDSTKLPLVGTGGLAKYSIEVDVTDGMLEFGIIGMGEENKIPGGNWIVFDDFEVKWSSKAAIQNAGFEEDFTGWFKESSVENMPYIESKGVDGSKSVTFWAGSDYRGVLSQSQSGLPNGQYVVSVMTNSNVDSSFVVFGESGGQVFSIPVLQGGLTKNKLTVEVTDGNLVFGVKGSGENDGVPAGNWVVVDDFEVVRQPAIPVYNPGFELDFDGWVKASNIETMPYIENKGVDGSKSVTFWQGSAYWAYTYQEATGLANGTYEISAMVNTPNDSIFQLFGTGAEEEYIKIFNKTSGLEKYAVTARATDGTLNFGISGAGVNDSVPAGNWVVFDNFELKIKSITPFNEMVFLSPHHDSDDELDVKDEDQIVTFRQDNEFLNIHSNESIMEYAVYSINGSLITTSRVSTSELSIRLNKGIFVVNIITESGHTERKKVFIF